MTKKIIKIILVIFVCSQQVKANKCLEASTPLVDIVAEPKKFLNKKIYLEGDFYSYSTLALDYPKAMKSSKDFIGIVLSRPDAAEIPLVELKIAAPVLLFKDTNLNIDQGDRIGIKAKIYAIALGEAWLDAESIEIIKKNSKKND